MPTNLTAEQTARLQELRRKCLSDPHMPIAELKEGLAIIRQDRMGSQIASSASKKAKVEKVAAANAPSLLDQLKARAAQLQAGTQGGAA